MAAPTVALTRVLDKGRKPIQEDVTDELGEEEAEGKFHHTLKS